MTARVGSAQPACRPRVFIVDDDPDMRNVLCAILRGAGQICEPFASAQAFLQAIESDSAGCLLLDIRMPEISGPQLQTIMVERGFRMPIIFLSAAADVPTAVGVLQRGAVDLIEKPCKPAVLRQAVLNALARDGAQRAELGKLNALQRRMSELTPREREVASLLANGNSNRQTALALGLSERTVEIHRGRIMAKMCCDSIVSFGVQWAQLQSSLRSAGGNTPPP